MPRVRSDPRAGAHGGYFNTVDLVNRLEGEVRLGKADASACQPRYSTVTWMR